MLTLKINNSFSQILGLSIQDFKALREELSYQIDPGNFFANRYGPQIKYMLDKRGSFQTGLLHRVTAFLDLRSLPYKAVDERKRPKGSPGTWKGISPYKSQLEAVKVTKSGRGIISMPTGSGKSLVIALIASRLNLNTLVVVPSLEIKSQLIEAFRAFKCDMAKITVENIDSSRMKTLTAFDCLIIDEAHHVAARTYQKLNKTTWKGIYYRFFLTATPFRNNPEQNLLFEGIAGQVIYELTYAEAVTEGYIVPIEAYYLESPVIANDYHTYAEVYANLIVNNQARNLIIAQTLVSLNAAQAATLCIVKEVAHGEALAKLTGFAFVTGQDEDSRKYISLFNKGMIKVLIGTQGILGEGVDTKPAEYVVVAGIGKAKSAFMQTIGRVLRAFPGKESGKVLIIKDKSHKFPLTHFKTQVKILEEVYNVKPERLE